MEIGKRGHQSIEHRIVDSFDDVGPDCRVGRAPDAVSYPEAPKPTRFDDVVFPASAGVLEQVVRRRGRDSQIGIRGNFARLDRQVLQPASHQTHVLHLRQPAQHRAFQRRSIVPNPVDRPDEEQHRQLERGDSQGAQPPSQFCRQAMTAAIARIQNSPAAANRIRSVLAIMLARKSAPFVQ